eukprot:RCo012925
MRGTRPVGRWLACFCADQLIPCQQSRRPFSATQWVAAIGPGMDSYGHPLHYTTTLKASKNSGVNSPPASAAVAPFTDVNELDSTKPEPAGEHKSSEEEEDGYSSRSALLSRSLEPVMGQVSSRGPVPSGPQLTDPRCNYAVPTAAAAAPAGRTAEEAMVGDPED